MHLKICIWILFLEYLNYILNVSFYNTEYIMMIYDDIWWYDYDVYIIRWIYFNLKIYTILLFCPFVAVCFAGKL